VRADRLPLDGRAYVEAVRALERLIRATPDLSNLAAIRDFLATAPPGLIGVRTAEDCAAADDEKLRVMIRYMILGTTAMKDLHDATRQWLDERGYALPPWDPQAGAPHQRRRITYGGRLAATVTWTPQPSVSFADGLSDPERRWVLAMAIAAGERREWTEADLQRFAAYLTMGGASFAADRVLSDAQIGAKHGVPESGAALRRSLDDLDL